jgi:uncharacterized protein
MSSNGQNWKEIIQNKMSRRGFLRGMTAAGAAAAASSIPGGALIARAAQTPSDAQAAAQTEINLPFTPIEPSTADDIVLAEGFSYQLIAKRGDVINSAGRVLGDNLDWMGWFPIDYLEGGNSQTEGVLAINNEYFNSLFVSGWTGGEKTLEQVNAEKAMVGVTHLHVRRDGDRWVVVTDSEFARRYDATDEIEFSGPAAGTDVVGGATTVIGTVANCSGGITPWMTNLSCEENYQDYFGEDKNNLGGGGYQWYEGGGQDRGQLPEHYGWVVETDPYTGRAVKRTALGRFRHENVAPAIGKTGKLVLYMGDDKRDECVYKFVTAGTYNAEDRDANLDLLDEGTLYVANFGRGTWVPVVYEGNEELLGDPANVGGYTIASQAEVLTYCAQAARALGGTRTDRPEDIEVHPATGDVYIAFTNNSNHGNFHGQIVRLLEADSDPEALNFNFDVFAVGGPQSGFSSPDNLAFDTAGNLWMVTDVSTGSLNSGIYEFHGNNAIFMFPTDNVGKSVTNAYRFGSVPVEAESCGPTFVGDDTLFLNIQHPGEESESVEEPTSVWPDGDQPRSALVAITGPFPKGEFPHYAFYDARNA